MSMTKTEQQKAADAAADPMAEVRSSYDHETGTLTEPTTESEPQVIRNQVDPIRDPKLFEEESESAAIPRRGDPFAHQRDTKAAEAGAKAEQKESDAQLRRTETPEARNKRESAEAARRNARHNEDLGKMSDKR